MKILLAAGEAVPFCKTGGLADVVGALAPKLASLGHEVLLFLPRYRAIDSAALDGGGSQPLSVPLGSGTFDISLRVVPWKSAKVCFVEYAPFFDRDGLYLHEGRDHGDNDARFILFSRAVLEGAKALGFKPDVAHAHDWQAALVAAYLKRQYRSDPFFSRTASVLTVHNMAFQGNFPRESLFMAGFGAEDLAPESFEFYGRFSFLKAGLVTADVLTTVSPTYAREIQASDERGFGMEGLLRARSEDLQGILNGLDPGIWDPARDPHLPRKYSAKSRAAGKAACKKNVQEECGLEVRPEAPLIGVVSRLDYQKGLDLAIEAVGPRLGRCELAVLGSGDPALQESFSALSRHHPGLVHFHLGFDDPFAHRLYAAADVFLMPSRFEPCGLGQMIAMRYGAVPVAGRTGGLADTVFERAEDGGRPNGFLCAPGDAQDLARALDRALAAYESPSWSALVQAGMAQDFSWDRSVGGYLDVYERARARSGAAKP